MLNVRLLDLPHCIRAAVVAKDGFVDHTFARCAADDEHLATCVHYRRVAKDLRSDHAVVLEIA